MRLRPVLFLTCGAVILCATLPARADEPPAPQFEFAKRPDAPADWKVQAKGGLVITGGNSQSHNATVALTSSRQAGADKISLDGNAAYGQADVLVAVKDATGAVVALTRQSQTTANEWRGRGRYDRFFTGHNSGYLLGQVGGDEVAGKSSWEGGQVGYSREVYKSARHTAVAEVGYDILHEHYVENSAPAVTIHSGRLFAGELFALSKATGLSASVELLSNLNRETALNANDATGATRGVRPLHDTRVVAKAALTTILYRNLSFAFSFTYRYDQNPAPLPVPSAAGSAMYATGFQPFAERTDTLTEATFVFTFL